jgi:adenine/guanine phosphoribosyltransferase-like PRPP-binding protein
MPVGLTEEEERDALLELRRREVELAEHDFAHRRKSAKWDVIATIGTAVIPIATFLGLQRILK